MRNREIASGLGKLQHNYFMEKSKWENSYFIILFFPALIEILLDEKTFIANF